MYHWFLARELLGIFRGWGGGAVGDWSRQRPPAGAPRRGVPPTPTPQAACQPAWHGPCGDSKPRARRHGTGLASSTSSDRPRSEPRANPHPACPTPLNIIQLIRLSPTECGFAGDNDPRLAIGRRPRAQPPPPRRQAGAGPHAPPPPPARPPRARTREAVGRCDRYLSTEASPPPLRPRTPSTTTSPDPSALRHPRPRRPGTRLASRPRPPHRAGTRILPRRCPVIGRKGP